MANEQINFNDGQAYERYMGIWSQRAGDDFLDWVAPKTGLRWLDVGCGNGAFTEILVAKCAPALVEGIDPSLEQIAFAQKRESLRAAKFQNGNAMELPFSNDFFDIAVMPLVLFFVPNPGKGVSEMTRVVSPGGTVSAYSWDLLGGGFPYFALQEEMRAMGVPVLLPPSPEAANMEVLQALWTNAGLENIEIKEIKVERTFSDFDDYWDTILGGPSLGPQFAAMGPEKTEHLKGKMRGRLPFDSKGRITYGARANAVKGRVPT